MTNDRPSATQLLLEFNQTLGVHFDAPRDLMTAAQDAIDGCEKWRMHPKTERTRRLIALVNAKLRLNKERFRGVLNAAAKERTFLHYHDKTELAECLNYGDKARLERWLHKVGCKLPRSARFEPLTDEQSIAGLRKLLKSGTVNRSDARRCDLFERQTEILRSLFGGYVFRAFPAQAMHCCFNADARSIYQDSFYSHLREFHRALLHRDCSMVYLSVDSPLTGDVTFNQLRDALCDFIAKTYDRLANHCYLAIRVTPFCAGAEDGQWRLFSDVILYAEKHREVKLTTGYFRSDDIAAATANYIPGLRLDEARFEVANEGFFFRDCFVISRSTPTVPDGDLTTSGPIELLLLLEKNERDERIVPCPACRSFDVVGNSYPALGVRSWECRNAICPDRSAFDRGNRYSLSGIVKREAIKSDGDQIPEWSLRRWKLDVVFGVNDDAITDMLVRHFSLHGDNVIFVNAETHLHEKHGRSIRHETFDPKTTVSGAFKAFREAAFFKRFVISRRPKADTVDCAVPQRVKGATLYHGDCFEVLSGLKDGSADGAITSPPYYNAKSYTTWPNIYSFLYDMYNSAREAFRVLKPGSVYLFNIFDCFDNENSVVFSAMGKKRMILGAYVIDLFRRAGFELRSNVVWYKGEIEGKRNFNGGNWSPYYQFPFNCWEHCLIFRKPHASSSPYSFPTILDAKPVFKMIRGENTLGHSAPFPAAIPKLLASQMMRGACLLDPFAGSMTTARVAHEHGLCSISIETHKEYCDLGLRLLEAQDREAADSLYLAGPAH